MPAQDPYGPLRFSPSQRNPKGLMESWCIVRDTDESLGRMCKDISGTGHGQWYPDAKLQRSIPEVPDTLGTNVTAAREIVSDAWLAQGGGEPAREPEPPPAPPAAPETGSRTIFDDL